MFPVWLFQHDETLHQKKVCTYSTVEEAIKSGIRIIKLLCQDFNEEVYLFMENSEQELDGESLKGIHIYNGNVNFGIFIENGELNNDDHVGPLTDKGVIWKSRGAPSGEC